MDLDIRKYLTLILRWWWLLVVSTVVPMVASYYFASQQLDLYQAKATLMVGTSLENPDPDPFQMNLSNTLAAAYADLIRQGPFVEAVIERLGLQRTPEELAAQIQTSIRSGAQLLEIYVTDTNPDAAALIANALADELIRRSPASGGSDPEQQEFIRSQLEELQEKIGSVGGQIDQLTASLSELTSAVEIQDAQDQIAALEEVRSVYQSSYAGLLDVYRAESPNALSLFDPAAVPQWPIPDKTKLIVAAAGVAGLGLALGAVFLIEYMDTSLRWEANGERSILELPVLGVVPKVSRKKIFASGDSSSPVAEAVRTMRTNIHLIRPDVPFRTLLLTSPGFSEGKSFVLGNLAVALASAGNRVIAIDANMRKPKLHEFFEQPNVVGLTDVLNGGDLEGENSFSVPLQATNFENLYLLSTGRPPADVATLLTSARFPALLEFLRDHGDVILIDSPPILGPPDATVLATLVEGTILVVSAGITRRELARQARDRLLAQQGVDLLGFTINRAKLKDGYDYHGSGQDGGGMNRRVHRASDDESWLKVDEVAACLGVSKAMVRRWCKDERVATRRFGLCLRVSRQDVNRLMEVQMISETLEKDTKV